MGSHIVCQKKIDDRVKVLNTMASMSVWETMRGLIKHVHNQHLSLNFLGLKCVPISNSWNCMHGYLLFHFYVAYWSSLPSKWAWIMVRRKKKGNYGGIPWHVNILITILYIPKRNWPGQFSHSDSSLESIFEEPKNGISC